MLSLIKGKHVILRFVEEFDAQFILDLRTKEKAKYLSKTDNNLDNQINWIKNYKNREKDGKEFYFVIENKKNERIGLVRAYKIEDNSATSGSWIMLDGVKTEATLEGVLLLYEFILEYLGKEKIFFDVRKDNKKVWRFHKSYGAVQIDEDELDYFFEFSKDNFKIMKEEYKKYL
ncbi:GNAT family N-acetyltransferase [Aliarcobacter butzleri]|uniref:GNAT family N-acetyltransferase n=1 Tax=Aliarcobacter butzleri TaxID=28197 RepID=UPI0021B1C09D|nr:GNAT family N-acetyltransferase [Aliarcobacter butzleri]MCT7537426.1 GNAT family N-acetyltransferase [Aliarcobacter butzleri]MCT7623905.1 GNAT family N-acetyltransferase [Aliarcobacter butzleri]